jgi:cysteine desulfurase/selenocysteine lyase
VRSPDDPAHLDFVVFSAHKMYAPYGIGALVGPRDFFDRSEPDEVGGGTVELVTSSRAYWAATPDRDEPGTPNLLGVVALGRAIACLTEVGFDAIATHERDLTAYALRRLAAVPGLALYGDAEPVPREDRIGVIPFNLEGYNHSLLATVLSCEGAIGVRSGCFCAHPFIQKLLELDDQGASDLASQILGRDRRALPGLVRMSFGVFSTERDVDAAVDLLTQIAKEGPRGKYFYDAASGEYRAEGHVVELDPSLGF